MKKCKLLLLLIIGFLPAVWTYAQLISHTLPPVDDTYIYGTSNDQTVIRGMEHFLKTYHTNNGNQFRRITFLKFDISGMSPYIESATFRIYTTGFPAGGDNDHQFDLYPVAINTWAEDDITFLNYKDKVGQDMTPLLASYIVPAGEAMDAQYIEFSSDKLTQYITDSVAAGKQFISFRIREAKSVKKGADAVIVEFHSKENESGFFPQLVIEEKEIEQLKLKEITVDGVAISDFSENQYRYTVKLPWNETAIPEVNAIAKYPDNTNVSVTQATNLAGSLNERTAYIAINSGDTELIYSVVFELLPPPTDARLALIKINGKVLEFFHMDKTTYTVYLPYTLTSVPEIEVETNDPNATYGITPAGSIISGERVENRTSRIQVTSANGEVSHSYEIIFEQLPELDIFFAIGQSNMAGRAPYDAYKEELKNVFLLTPENEMEIASNPMNKYSNIRKDLSIQGLSPAFHCAESVQAHVKKPIGFVVNAQGGSSIISWYAPGKSNYDASIQRAKEAQAFGKIKAVIWHQGESDKSSAANDNYVTYKSNMSKLVENLRNDLNEPDLLFICGELSQLEDREEFNEEVIQKVSSYITNSDYVSTRGTALFDGTHFDTPSVKILGERYAEKLIEHLYKTTSVEKPVIENFPLIQLKENGIRIENIDKECTYTIHDLSGKLLQKGLVMPEQSIEISLSKGFYMTSLHQSGGNLTQKIIIP